MSTITPEPTPPRVRLRITAVFVLGAVVLGYTAAVVAGAIPKTQQLDATHVALLFLTLITCAVVVRPQVLDRLARLEGLGFKVELLQRLQERQVEQAEELQRLDLIIPLLFRDGERKHL